MGGGGGKGSLPSWTGILVNPLEYAFGDVGGWISNPLGKGMEALGVGWAEPLSAATSGFTQAAREGRAQMSDLYNPLMFGQTAQDRMAAEDRNKQGWDDYYKAMAADYTERAKKMSPGSKEKSVKAAVLPATVLTSDNSMLLTSEDEDTGTKSLLLKI